MTDQRAWAPALVLVSGLLLVLGIRDPNGQELREPLATLPTSLGAFGSEDKVLDAAELAANGASSYLFRFFSDSASRQGVFGLRGLLRPPAQRKDDPFAQELPARLRLGAAVGEHSAG